MFCIPHLVPSYESTHHVSCVRIQGGSVEQDALSPDLEAPLLWVYSYLATFITLLISTFSPSLFSLVQAQELASHSFDRLTSSSSRFSFQSVLCFVYTGYTHYTLLNHAFL